jgi:N-acetylmuramoyl-L-alanine amidase
LATLTRRQLLGMGGPAVGRPFPALSPLLMPVINPRSAWALDRPPKAEPIEEEVRFLIVHHSASNNGHRGSEVPGILRGFYDFHTASRGWADIAYNFLIDVDGGIWEGRAGSIEGPVAGDATGGNQGFTQLVCLIGDFEATRPSPAALASLVELLAWLADRYDISTAPDAEVTFVSRGSNLHPAGVEVTSPTITGHRTMSQTSCPGAELNAYVMGKLSADVDARRAEVAVSTTTSAPSTTTTSTVTTSTSTAPTTSTILSTSTSSAPPQAPTTPPLASGAGDLAGPGWLSGATVAVAILGGLLVWRHRRMTRGAESSGGG